MTARNPLVLLNGSIAELPAGDTLNGAGSGGGSGVSEAKMSFAGALSVQTGIPRWYPDRAVTLQKVYFSLGQASGNPVVIDVKKNGVSIFSGTFPTCIAGANLSSLVAVTTALATTDYLTVDITSATSDGAYLTAVIVYA